MASSLSIAQMLAELQGQVAHHRRQADHQAQEEIAHRETRPSTPPRGGETALGFPEQHRLPLSRGPLTVSFARLAPAAQSRICMPSSITRLAGMR